MSFRLIWIFCLIVAGGILTLTFFNQREHTNETTTISETNKPTVSFQNIDMIINSPIGLPQYRLAAPKYWLYHEQQTSEFESPDIIIFNDNGSKIYATSEKGHTKDDNDVITLIGNVEVKQPASTEEPDPLSIYTNELTVSQSLQQVKSDLPVVAIRGSQKITALGMTLNLNNKVLELHSDVKGIYDPL
ncbi:MAG: LPS export ABC transporter periplasmic protein LptC [Pseudomonadota bacterium]